MIAKIYEFDGDDDRIYYTSVPNEIGIFERKWLNALKKEIIETSKYEHNILVNLTWFKSNWDETAPLRELVSKVGPKDQVKIWFAGSIDGNHWITYDYVKIYHFFVENEYHISFVGYSNEHWHTWYPQWFIENTDPLEVDKLNLNESPNNLYLAYNRKPRMHRIQLIDALIEKQILDKGWVTFEHGHYPQIDIKTGFTDQDKHSTDIRFTRPEDLTSLGDLNIWRDSYLVVVSETDHDDPWQLSEKTWKPIFGLRPFLINGRKEVYEVLEKLGFYTPKDLFKNSKLDCHYTSVASQIQSLYHLPPYELHKLWESQYDMLMYNRKRMFEMANSDPNKILNWPQAKSKPYSVPVFGCAAPNSVIENGAAVAPVTFK